MLLICKALTRPINISRSAPWTALRLWVLCMATPLCTKPTITSLPLLAALATQVMASHCSLTFSSMNPRGIIIKILNLKILVLGVLLSSSILAKDIEPLKNQAESGNLEAQFKLASEYHKNKNYRAAFEWLLKASNKGHAAAQFNLSSLYFNGEGVVKSNDEAIKWLIKSGEQGIRAAQVHLNELYHRGIEIPKNYIKAAYWAEKAADLGHVESQYILAVYYDAGNGVSQSDKLSTVWFSKAAHNGHAQAQSRLAMAYQYGIGISPDEELSKQWYKKAVKNGDPYAKPLLVIAYDISYSKDVSQTNYWSKQVALSGDVEAMFMLSKYYFSINTTQGFENSYVWANLMIENGAKAEKLIMRLTKRLNEKSIEQAKNKAKNLMLN